MSDNNVYIPKHDLISQNMAIDFRKSGSYIPAHWHSALEIAYLVDGEAAMTVEGEIHKLVKGEFIVVDAGRIHEYLCAGKYRQLVIHIDNEYIASFMDNQRDFQIFCDRSELTEELVDVYLEVCDILQELVLLCTDRPYGYRIRCESLVLHILHRLLTCFSVHLYKSDLPEPSKNQRRIREIVSYIAENYNTQITLEDISDRFGLSSEYFSRLFTQKVGIPFKKHLNQVRLSHIYHDLCSTDAPIMEIVDRHGFTNYKLFNRMFKEIYGATPRTIRQRNSQLS